MVNVWNKSLRREDLNSPHYTDLCRKAAHALLAAAWICVPPQPA
jgi:hypothetical protein